MSLDQFWTAFVTGIKNSSVLELIAVITGIVSVWFSRKASVLTYPIGLINTIAYVYLSVKTSLFGEASVNFYYTIMNVYGWWVWTRRNERQEKLVHIEFSNQRMLRNQFLFFAFFYVVIFIVLDQLKSEFYPGVLPWADALASATAFTGMWLMTRKKVESWWWWIATNIVSVPLYFSKQLVLTSVYYAVLLVMAVAGLITWSQKARSKG